jgi:hypothetical protein
MGNTVLDTSCGKVMFGDSFYKTLVLRRVFGPKRDEVTGE